jgi:hypothetical protein
VAILPIAIDSADLTDVALLGSPGGTVIGRVITDAGVPPTIPQLRVTLAVPQAGQADPSLIGAFRNPGSSEVAADGTFIIKGVFGRSRIRLTLPDEWMVKAITHDGRDVTDQPIELRSGESFTGLEVVVTDRVSTISGHVTDAKGTATSDGTVVIFPEDASRWGEDSRLVRAVRPDRQGQYRVKGLPAGDYRAIAIDYVETGLWNDPEFLDSLRRHAAKLTVSDGGTHDLPLKTIAAELLQ